MRLYNWTFINKGEGEDREDMGGKGEMAISIVKLWLCLCAEATATPRSNRREGDKGIFTTIKLL
jgi:hypothetical protein